jgi:hypothetical protein
MTLLNHLLAGNATLFLIYSGVSMPASMFDEFWGSTSLRHSGCTTCTH